MREAARALDDVSDHLGEVLRRADELLAEWSRLGVQVRAQVEREAAAIGEVVDGAVARAAGAGIDRAIADRLRVLTAELERLEQRTRAASRAVAEHREGDRRVLWIVVAGVVLANALLVAILLRKPEPAPVAEPIRIETPVPAQPAEPARTTPAAAQGSGDAVPGSAGSPASGLAAPPAGAGSNAAPDLGSHAAPGPGSNTAALGSGASSNTATSVGGPSPNVAVKPGTHAPTKSAPRPARPTAEPTRLTPSPIALPPRSGGHGRKKQP